MPINEIAEKAFRNHGSHPIAYTTLQEGVDYFFFKEGYIAFRKAGLLPTAFTLGDPVCADENIDEIIGAFVEEHPRACFCQIFNPRTAEALEKRGFYVNEFGLETMLDLDTYTLSGKKKQIIRTARNQARKEGIEVVESTMAEIGREAINEISNYWISTKVSDDGELSFLARAVADNEDNGMVRQFYAVKEGEVLGFVFFDPTYRNGEIVGYAADVLRTKLIRSKGLLDYVMTEAIERFKQEGIPVLSIGFSPFAKVDDSRYRHSPFTKWLFQHSHEHLNHVYSFKGLAWHKSRYQGREEKVYFASKRKFSLFQILTLYGLCGIYPVKKSFTSPIKSIKPNLIAARDLFRNFFFLFPGE